jgi:hypothetical protein
MPSGIGLLSLSRPTATRAANRGAMPWQSSLNGLISRYSICIAVYGNEIVLENCLSNNSVDDGEL